MEFITTLLLLIILALPIIYLVVPSRKVARIAKHIDKLPGPPKYPLIGTTAEVLGIKREDLYEHCRKRNKTYGPIYRLWFGDHGAVHLLKAEHFEKILGNSTNLMKTIMYDNIKPWMGEGMLLAAGAKWHRNRKLITPAFHFKVLEGFVEVFNEKMCGFVEVLKGKTGKQFDMYPYITNCTLDVICETAMGIQLNAMSEGSREYVDAVYQISELAVQRHFRPWLRSDAVYYRTDDGKKFMRCLEILHGFSSKVLTDRKKAMRGPVDKVSEEDAMMGKKTRLAFLDLLLEASKDGAILNDDEVRNEVDTFMFAGHDTITVMVNWSLCLLGNHPEIQEQVRDEINSIFPEDEKLTIKDLNEMKYLDRVMKETLRLYPSAPTIGRYLSKDITIDKHFLPAGTSVYMHFDEVHRDSDYYDEPEVFNPDRFLPENSRNRHPYAYVPFSAGPRNCIGQKFALYEVKTLLAWVVRNFKIKAMERAQDVRIYKEIVMRPQNGLQVILEPIES